MFRGAGVGTVFFDTVSFDTVSFDIVSVDTVGARGPVHPRRGDR